MTTQEDVQERIQRPKIGPLPYFPQLCRVLGGVTISIVLVYLEIHHSPLEPDPDAQPARAGLRMPPVSLHCDQACEDLGVSRRTLHTALDALSVWWKLESQRSGAARSAREFLQSSHSLDRGKLDAVRPYSIVGSREYNAPRTLAIHRNPPRLEQILVDASVITAVRCVTSSDTAPPTSVASTVLDVLGNALNLRQPAVGLAWGWSQKRVLEHSERMTRLWAERRERVGKVGKTAS